MERPFRRILLSAAAADHPRAAEVVGRFPGAEVEVEAEPPKAGVLGLLDRQTLRLDVFKGPFLKPCPCSAGARSCGYYVLAPIVGCPFECSYCALQDYLNVPAITLYLNLEDLFAQLHDFLRTHPGRLFRLGTGELTDSLTLEPAAGYAPGLIEFFGEYSNAFFELKTKSAAVEGLLSLRHGGRTVIGFSVNPAEVVGREERGTASLDERLEAAAKVVAAGYRLAFHFDPVIDLAPVAGAEESAGTYLELIEELGRRFPGEVIAWVSVGGLRFTSRLYHRLRESRAGEFFLRGEFAPGFDQKMRYLRPRRRALFSLLVRELRRFYPRSFIYLCMEDAALNRQVLAK